MSTGEEKHVTLRHFVSMVTFCDPGIRTADRIPGQAILEFIQLKYLLNNLIQNMKNNLARLIFLTTIYSAGVSLPSCSCERFL